MHLSDAEIDKLADRYIVRCRSAGVKAPKKSEVVELCQVALKTLRPKPAPKMPDSVDDHAAILACWCHAAAERSIRLGRGQPSIYSPELAATICEMVASGMTLQDALKADDMPTVNVWHNWCKERPELATMYAEAQDARSNVWADETVKLADEAQAGDDPALLRQKIAARQWLLERTASAKYGNKTKQEISGPGGGPLMFIKDDLP